MNDKTENDVEQTPEEDADVMMQEGEASEGKASEGEGSEGEGEVSGEETETGLAEPPEQDLPQDNGESEDYDENVNIALIMDLPLQVVVELGRTKMLINDLLQIGQGSVIELNKQVGEALDVLVNGKLVARGEVVVVKDKFGVRITEVLSTIERIKQLG